jgi:hypothetical protein
MPNKLENMLRMILENQVVLAEGVWMLLQAQGRSGALDSLSNRIKASRQLLDEYEGDGIEWPQREDAPDEPPKKGNRTK